MAESKKPVIIVGAGPVGLLIALRLGQQNIPTLVLEAYHELYPATRAMAYMPMINAVISELGLMNSVSKNAFLNHQGITWRRLDGTKIANLPLVGQGNEFGGVYQIGQARMNALILEKIKECPSVEVKFGMKCVGIDDDPANDCIRVMCHTPKPPDDDVFFEGSYVIGTDGANSTVRRLCCIPFEGYTFNEFKMIGADILFDFEREMKYTPMNFFVDPDEWGVIAYTGEKGDGTEKDGEEKIPQWRVAWVEPPHLPAEKTQYLERATNRISSFMKGRKDFKIVRAESYWIHQRCAASARKGRVMLAGDALHSNNPIGGLGLTGGILDSLVYGNALTRVMKGGEPDSLLTDCANSRREVWLSATAKLAMGNLKRLGEFGEDEARIRDEFFNRLNGDPEFPKVVRRNFDSMIPDTFEKPISVT